MEKLKTATGKEFDCDYFNPFPPGGADKHPYSRGIPGDDCHGICKSR